ncbi:MAG: DUF421 domain-containing protein [Chloroflexi bacterium]|nr:DUF421 domain-containing protein [Chloroflexota bacterium]
MDFTDLVYTAGRTVVIYVFVLIVVRLLGKRTVGDITPFDLIVAFILSEVVDEPIYGDVTLLQGLVPIAAVAVLHYLNSFLSYHWPAFEKLTGGEALVLIRDGKKDKKAMAQERISDAELESMLRESEIDKMDQVKLATLETNGKLSILKTEEARELQKGDVNLAKLKEKVRA